MTESLVHFLQPDIPHEDLRGSFDLDAEDAGATRVLEKNGFVDTREQAYPGVARWAREAA